jgi:hypothetical protein
MEPSRPRVALLIDGENSTYVSIPSLLAEAGKLGDVMIRRVYGNWSLSSKHAWQEIAPRYGLEQRHHGKTAPGKNATDIALVVDAMDILYSGAIEHFCLVTSDSDYSPWCCGSCLPGARYLALANRRHLLPCKLPVRSLFRLTSCCQDRCNLSPLHSPQRHWLR